MPGSRFGWVGCVFRGSSRNMLTTPDQQCCMRPAWTRLVCPAQTFEPHTGNSSEKHPHCHFSNDCDAASKLRGSTGCAGADRPCANTARTGATGLVSAGRLRVGLVIGVLLSSSPAILVGKDSSRNKLLWMCFGLLNNSIPSQKDEI